MLFRNENLILQWTAFTSGRLLYYLLHLKEIVFAVGALARKLPLRSEQGLSSSSRHTFFRRHDVAGRLSHFLCRECSVYLCRQSIDSSWPVNFSFSSPVSFKPRQPRDVFNVFFVIFISLRLIAIDYIKLPVFSIAIIISEISDNLPSFNSNNFMIQNKWLRAK